MTAAIFPRQRISRKDCKMQSLVPQIDSRKRLNLFRMSQSHPETDGAPVVLHKECVAIQMQFFCKILPTGNYSFGRRRSQ
jgi:hypothetical protein